MRRLLGALAAALPLALTAAPTLAAPPAVVAPEARPRPAAPLPLTNPLDATTAAATLARRFGPQSRLGRDADGRLHALRRLDARLDPRVSSADAVAHVFAENRDLLGLSAALTATHAETLTLPSGAGHTLRFTLAVSGVPLERRSLAARILPDGRLAELRMDPLPRELHGGTTPTLAPADARLRAGSHLNTRNAGAATLVIHVGNPSVGRLAWRVSVAPVPLAKHAFVWLDAHDGAVLETRDAAHH